ncbi:hypothetical protein Nepgr_023932 [Nepenthes gracilis]|uniref:Uncharacterized protein n=1 Tax=Nepenthes gracilis TaxID=150966 RepID=A0AAD3T3N8_NEPGR|nr:hypothetical protein Nepgr_023932 [Nepenthes gracilis]
MLFVVDAGLAMLFQSSGGVGLAVWAVNYAGWPLVVQGGLVPIKSSLDCTGGAGPGFKGIARFGGCCCVQFRCFWG